MLRILLLALVTSVGCASMAAAQCTGTGGVPFNCAAAGSAPGATDLLLGGKIAGANTVKFTGLQLATGIFAQVATISGGGTANFLRADGSWAVPPSGSGSTSPGGSTGQVQYNNAGAFGGLTNTQLTADINVFSTSLSGAAPASGGGSANFLRADGIWAAPAGSGGGTVNSVSMTVPAILSVSGSPVTSSGTLAVSLATETANTVLAGPSSGSAAAPTFRALVAADLPLISLSSGASGTLQAAQEPAHTGDVTNSAGSLAMALATVNSNVGSFTNASVTVDAKGRVTAVSTGSGGGSVTWPASTDLVISNGTSSPAGLAPINGDCVVGSGGAWTAGACPGSPGALGMEIDFFYSGLPTASALLGKVFSRSTTVAASAPMKCNAVVGATASTTVTFTRIPSGTSSPTVVGTAVFSALGTTYQGCTVTWSSSVTFGPGDILTATFPGAPDVTLASVAISIPGVQ